MSMWQSMACQQACSKHTNEVMEKSGSLDGHSASVIERLGDKLRAVLLVWCSCLLERKVFAISCSPCMLRL
jgi:hypothetical protein